MVLTRSDTNWPVQLQKMVRSLKFGARTVQELTLNIYPTIYVLSKNISIFQVKIEALFQFNLKSQT